MRGNQKVKEELRRRKREQSSADEADEERPRPLNKQTGGGGSTGSCLTVTEKINHDCHMTVCVKQDDLLLAATLGVVVRRFYTAACSNL